MSAVSIGFVGLAIVLGVLFLLSLGGFGVVMILMLSKIKARQQQNDASPVLTVDARVAAKRIQVCGDHAHTAYFATFEVPSGDRMELTVPSREYGYLVERDQGKLTFQGDRFLKFERTINY